MTTENKNRFTVITNSKFHNDTEFRERHREYQTNPLKEEFVKFANNNDKKLKIEDLLKW